VYEHFTSLAAACTKRLEKMQKWLIWVIGYGIREWAEYGTMERWSLWIPEKGIDQPRQRTALPC
jgi:hypothetical protein